MSAFSLPARRRKPAPLEGTSFKPFSYVVMALVVALTLYPMV
jgi:hypothetical protein